MDNFDRLEARQVAVLRHPETLIVVGRLFLWESGIAEPMWFSEEVLDAIAEPLSGENSAWSKWKLVGPPGQSN